MNKKYDVIIVGGGTAGCACAWNCGKLGLKTLLLESDTYLGGTMTGGLVVPVMNTGQNTINTDFYKELIKVMKENNAQITYQNNPGWFNPFVLKDVLLNMLHDVKIDIILSAYIDKIFTDKNFIQSIKILSEYIGADYFVDATGELNFSKKINCNFLKNFSELPPVSLRFVMNDINLEKFADWLLEIDSDRNVTTVEHVDSQIHLSTAYTWDADKHWALAPYFNDAVEKGILKDTDRNYFQVFTISGMAGALAFNCPRIIDNVDNCYEYGKEVIQRIANFCIEYFPGFESAKIFAVADKLGIRSSNRIKGKYIYTIDDLRSGKKFDNPALISDYPVDVHSSKKDSSILEKTGEYQLPIESLMSADFENLFVAGRGLSADELAQGALRVQNNCFSMGEAVAKYIRKKI